MRGVDVGEFRWQELGNYLITRIGEHALPFQDLHYIYAFARAGNLDLVEEMLLSMEAHAYRVKPALQQPYHQLFYRHKHR